MQSYVQTARQKKTLDELLEWAATVEGPLGVRPRTLKSSVGSLWLTLKLLLFREKHSISRNKRPKVRETLPLRRSELLNIPRKLPSI